MQREYEQKEYEQKEYAPGDGGHKECMRNEHLIRPVQPMPEILAPAGNYKALEAAVKAGADAVYLAGHMFGARAYAGNFSEEEVLRALEYCHLFGIKVYLTVNTLLKQNETEKLAGFIRPLYKGGIDAVLVQDMGTAKILHDNFPDLPLHASTQMSISSHLGADFLKEFGFTRIVPSRELSLEEVKSIKERSNIETEVFVHGAMCFAYSGKCLMSSFLGGRSGNRGRCAQPCRKLYSFPKPDIKAGKNIHNASGAGYFMSLKDMCTLDILPELTDAGIDSFKIEGRMKNEYYVAACVKAYKEASKLYAELKSAEHVFNWEELSQKAKNKYRTAAEEYTAYLSEIYNRGGFCDGYYYKENCKDRGKTMFSGHKPGHMGVETGTVKDIRKSDVFVILTKDINRQDVLEIRRPTDPSGEEKNAGTGKNIELTAGISGKAGETVRLKGRDLRKIKPGMTVFRTRNNALLEKIEENILKPERRLAANASVTAVTGKPLTIEIENENACVEIKGGKVEAAVNRPTDAGRLKEKMNKTAGTGIVLDIKCDVSEDAFVEMSIFNELRRKAVEDFKKEIPGRYKRI